VDGLVYTTHEGTGLDHWAVYVYACGRMIMHVRMCAVMCSHVQSCAHVCASTDC